MIIGNKNFDTDNCAYVMGILNVTPDSFYDGSKYDVVDAAVKRALQMVREGASIIDIGGESTRPGYTPVSTEEECDRVLPVIEAIKKEIDIPISLDTFKPIVAREGIKAGADMINDIWGLKYDSEMAGVIAEGKVACTLMHNRDNGNYKSLIDDVATDLSETLNIAAKAGIDDDRIILDPGIGFAKDTNQNLECIRDIGILKQFGIPLLLGISRKSVIGNVLNQPVEERLPGTLALNLYGILNGVSFIRVHDVKEHVEAIKMLEAVKRA